MPGKKTNTQKNGHAHDQWEERKRVTNDETKQTWDAETKTWFKTGVKANVENNS
jgi:hypothetical protein